MFRGYSIYIYIYKHMNQDQVNDFKNILSKANCYLKDIANGITVSAELAASYGTGVSDATTLRTVTASNSPELAFLSGIETKIDTANAYLSAGVTKPSSNADAGVTTVTMISAASANATVVKARNGNVFGIDAMNNSSTIHYLKLYNKATAPTSSDTPLAVYMIPANTSGAGFVRDFAYPMEFSAGISYRIVTGIANNDDTSATGKAVVFNLQYE